MKAEKTENPVFDGVMAQFLGMGVILAAGVVGGCSATQGNVNIGPPAAVPAPPTCEVRLYMDHKDSDAEIHALDRRDLQEGVCIKWKGEDLEVPQEILLASNQMDTYMKRVGKNISAICQRKDARDGVVTLPSGAGTIDYCVWNHAYRSKFPFSMRLKVEAPGAELRDFVHLVRVFQNGRLAYAWNKVPNTQEIVIPHQVLKDSGLPFDAPLDLMIIPATVVIDEASVATQVQAASNRNAQALQMLGRAAIGAIVTNDPALKSAYDCYNWRLKGILWDLDQVTKGTAVPFPIPNPDRTTCNPIPVQGDLSLVQRYKEAKAKGQKALAEEENKVLVEIDNINATAGQAVRIIKQELTNQFNQWLNQKKLQVEQKEADLTKAEKAGDANRLQSVRSQLLTLKGELQEAETRLIQFLALADEIQGFARDLKISYSVLATRISSIKNDTAEQAKLFGYLAKELEANGSPFKPITPNPLPATGERVLNMTYRELWQWYFFAPWSGVPVRFKSGNGDPLFDESNIVPIIDVAGGRWQWGQSRFKEVRIGLGFMYFSDKVDTKDEETGAKKTEEKVNCGPEANIGLGNLRFGLAWGVCRKNENSPLRLVVGLDLVKILTGQNAELF